MIRGWSTKPKRITVAAWFALFFSVLGHSAAMASDVDMLRTNIGEMLPHLTGVDRGRILLIDRKRIKTEECINANGRAHVLTLASYFELYVTLDYSASFLERIRSNAIAVYVDRILELTKLMKTNYGFEYFSFAQITAGTFEHLNFLLSQLDEERISSPLKERLWEIRKEAVKVIALGRNGDRLKTLLGALPLQLQLREIREELLALPPNSFAYTIALEVEGLTEWYADYSQIDRIGPEEIANLLKAVRSNRAVVEEINDRLAEVDPNAPGSLLDKIIEVLEEK